MSTVLLGILLLFTATLLAQSDTAGALAAFCPNQSVLPATGGCKRCPQGSAIPVPPWKLKSTIAGHFTAPGVEELLLSGTGCEPHSLHFGGTALMRRTADGWRLVRYAPGLIATRCAKFHDKTGRDILVCRNEDGGQGTSVAFLYLIRFNGDGIESLEPFFQTDTDNTGACGDEESKTVQRTSIDRFERRDLNGDGIRELLVLTSLGKRPMSAAEHAACEKARYPAGRTLQIPMRRFRLEYTFDGTRFTPTPATRRLLVSFPKPVLH